MNDLAGGAVTPAHLRWQTEGDKHARSGDYAWMAERVGARRVLEIGCGAGFGTVALAARGCSVLALEPDADCIVQAAGRVAEAAPAPGGATPIFLQVMVGQLAAEARQQVLDFAPEWVVCWLMGADDAALNSALPPAQAVKVYRESVHRQLAELASVLPSVAAVHLVDRTAFPWKIKDTARQTLQLYHQATTFAGLPWKVELEDTLYRKLDQRQWPAPMGPRSAALGAAAAGIVPVLGSLIARRSADGSSR